MFLLWICLIFFSWLDWGYGLGGKDHGRKVVFLPHHIKSIHYPSDVWLLGSLQSQAVVVFVVSPPFSYSFFSYCHEWKEIANCTPHLRTGKLNTPFLEGRVVTCIVWSCPHRRFIISPPFICSFNHSCTSTWIHIYFILWVIIQYTSLLILFLIFF